jgi:energy-coupling factor transporter transmembrane protein EcfT
VARLGLASSLDPTCRLVSLALISAASFFSGSLFAVFLCLATVFLLLREGLRFSVILHDSAFIALFSVFTAGLRFGGLPQSSGHELWGLGISGAALALLKNMLAYGVRLLAVFLAGRLFYASTTASELRDAATRITRHIPILRRLDIGLCLSMVIGFIPQIFGEWQDSLEAARSRGMSRRPQLYKLSLFVTSFLRRLMLRAIATPEALVARGWTLDRGVTPSHWKIRDSITTFACGILAILASLHIV